MRNEHENPYHGKPGTLLFELAAKLSPRFGHERSFAVRPGDVYANRFLLSVSLAEIPGDVHEKILGVCGQMQMPPTQVELVTRHLPTTRFLHLGFEEGFKGIIYKIYLEQNTPAVPLAGKAILQHCGFKWDATNPNRQVLTRYVWYPALSLAEIRQRIDEVCAGETYRTIAREFVDFAGERVAEDMRYLEVAEAGNPRRSFDLNFYDAGLRIADIKSFLVRMMDYYRIESGKWQPIFEATRDDTFGHLSGGIHRDGGDFFNVYHGRTTVNARRDKPTF